MAGLMPGEIQSLLRSAKVISEALARTPALLERIALALEAQVAEEAGATSIRRGDLARSTMPLRVLQGECGPDNHCRHCGEAYGEAHLPSCQYAIALRRS